MAKLLAAECREFIRLAVEKAQAMGVPVAVAVVGPEGNIIAVIVIPLDDFLLVFRELGHQQIPVSKHNQVAAHPSSSVHESGRVHITG